MSIPNTLRCIIIVNDMAIMLRETEPLYTYTLARSITKNLSYYKKRPPAYILAKSTCLWGGGGLVVDNNHQYGNINHQPVGRLIKYISPHLASEQPSYASLNLGYR